jgi:MarR family transcriptional regulator, organic hydroperoxide resistance regulator
MRPAEELRYLVLAVQREGNRALAAQLRPLGITPSQAEALRVLRDHEPLTLSGLGELLICESGSSPSRLVDRLVAQGLVQRQVDPDDRRFVTLVLTADGRKLVRKIMTAERRLYDLLDRLSVGQDVDAALEVLRGIADAFPAGQALARRRGDEPVQ